MNLFGKDETAVATVFEVGATEVLRRMVRARNKAPRALALIAETLPNVGVGALEAFGHGRGNLSPEVLQALANQLMTSKVRFDPELNRFIDLAPPATSMGSPPERYDPRSNPNFVQHGLAWRPEGPKLVEPKPTSGLPRPRPGFTGA